MGDVASAPRPTTAGVWPQLTLSAREDIWHGKNDHSLIRSYEPGEEWWCADELFFEVAGAPAAPSHP